MKTVVVKVLLVLFLMFTFIPLLQTRAEEETPVRQDVKFGIYFGGIGCPYCSNVAPELVKRVNNGEFIMIEYEIYQNLGNSQAFSEYVDSYGLSLGIPQVLFDRNNKESGDKPIRDNLDRMIEEVSANTIYFADGTRVSLEELNVNDLKRYPTIYAKDRVAIKKKLGTLTDNQNEQIKRFITIGNIEEAVEGLVGKTAGTERVQYSGGSLRFENALEVGGWLLQWNGESVEGQEGDNIGGFVEETGTGITIWKTIMLGLADSVNPCAIAVLALILISIVTYNPGNRTQILLAGLSFVLAVVIMYLFYGYLIIRAFEFIQSIAATRLIIYRGLGIAAIILGLLGLKDYFMYKPGGIGTEMPMFLRPKVNALIARVTSPLGAFGMGIFVTLFLLPCTIGPYIILGGLLAEQGFVSAIPLLLLYNFIFVLPMLVVTILVYMGSKRPEDVKDWKERNVRKMHLIGGALMLIIGILMVSGIF
jgi:cytochrome c biogenesis protein CcdA